MAAGALTTELQLPTATQAIHSSLRVIDNGKHPVIIIIVIVGMKDWSIRWLVSKFFNHHQYVPSSSMIVTQVSAFMPIMTLGFETLVICTENSSFGSSIRSSMIGTLPQSLRSSEEGSNVTMNVVVS